jgi:hypothetical protein
MEQSSGFLVEETGYASMFLAESEDSLEIQRSSCSNSFQAQALAEA